MYLKSSVPLMSIHYTQINDTALAAFSSISKRFAGIKINVHAAFFALMLLVEFIGKNFNFLIALRALAGERFQVLEVCESRAMCGCAHGMKPPLEFCYSETRAATERP
jgi:ABC-type microcin C transport system permease subunit YejB